MGGVVAQGDMRPMAGNREAMDDLQAHPRRPRRVLRQGGLHARHAGPHARRGGCRAAATRGTRSLRRGRAGESGFPAWRGAASPHALARATTRCSACGRASAKPQSRRAMNRGVTTVPDAVDYRTEPCALPPLEARASTARRDADARTSPRTAASARATSSSSTPTTSASTSSSHDALAPHPLRASRGARGRRHQRHASASSARAPTSSCSALSIARLEGELLQVHQRDAQRHRGREPPFRPQVRRRRQRRMRRRRLRAGARLRRDPAGRRPLVGGVAARSAAARRAARHRRPDARHRQAPRAPRPSPTSSARRPKACAASARIDWRLVDALAKPAQFARRGARARARELGRRQRSSARTRKGVRAAAASSATIDADGYHYEHVDVATRPRARAPRRSRVRGAGGAQPRRTSPPSRPPAPTGGRSRWRASSTTRS